MDASIVVAAMSGVVATASMVMTYRASRQATTVNAQAVNANDRANQDSALLKWAEQLRASEQASREEARQSRDRADRIKDEADVEVEEIRAQVASLKSELRKATEVATKLTDRLTMAQMEAWRPEPDVAALRRLLGRPGGGGGTNGRSL